MTFLNISHCEVFLTAWVLLKGKGVWTVYDRSANWEKLILVYFSFLRCFQSQSALIQLLAYPIHISISWFSQTFYFLLLWRPELSLAELRIVVQYQIFLSNTLSSPILY